MMLPLALLLLLSFGLEVCCAHRRIPFEAAIVQPEKFLATFEKELLMRRKYVSRLTLPTSKLLTNPSELRMLKVSPSCSLALYYYVTHPKSSWSLKMADSSAKSPSGLMEGAIHWIGSFDECFGNSPPDKYPYGKAPGSHYCRLPISTPTLPKGVNLQVGMCAPDTCTEQDVASYTNASLKSLNQSMYVVNGAVCWLPPQDLPLTKGAIAMIVVCSFTVFLMLLGTAYDVLVLRRRTPNPPTPIASSNNNSELGAAHEVPEGGDLPYHRLEDAEIPVGSPSTIANPSLTAARSLERAKTWEKCLVSFSIYTNILIIFNTKQAIGRLNCLDGIRFLSMAWVILGHTFFYISFYGTRSPFAGFINNPSFLTYMLKHWTYQTIINATFSVDTFFLLSGVLTSYLFLKKVQAVGTINNVKLWILFFFHRIWRLTPVYMLIIGFYTALSKYFSTGPFWNQTNFFEAKTCEKNWWRNLLYINNLVSLSKMCLPWSWFLSIDLQLHIFVASLLLPIFFFGLRDSRFYRKLYGFILTPLSCCAVILVSLLTTGIIYKRDLDSETDELFADTYLKPWCRAGPYVVGLALGLLLLIHQKRHFKLPLPLILLGWIIATGTCLAVLYGLSGVSAGNYSNSNSVTALYQAMSRFSWSLGVSWVIFASLSNTSGCINDFLSWKAFIPLSRLTYCAYLVHPIVLAYVYSSLRQAQIVTGLVMVCFFFAILILSYLVALVVSLAWEMPMLALEKALIRQ